MSSNEELRNTLNEIEVLSKIKIGIEDAFEKGQRVAQYRIATWILDMICPNPDCEECAQLWNLQEAIANGAYLNEEE